MRVPVSCFIIALNEADRLPRTIRAVRDWVDEVIVVDAGSTDGTAAVAAADGARVLHNGWAGFGPQKQFGEARCRNNWVLNIDADEEITPQLAAEMRALFADGEPSHAAYGFWVQMIYPGQDGPRPLARDHYCVRLYDKARCGFKGSILHDSVDPRGHGVARLAGRVDHHSFRSFGDLVRKADARASFSARHTEARPEWLLRLRMLTEFPVNFFRYYVVRRHLMGGWRGLWTALILARYRWARIVRAYARQRHGSLARRPGSFPAKSLQLGHRGALPAEQRYARELAAAVRPEASVGGSSR